MEQTFTHSCHISHFFENQAMHGPDSLFPF